MKHVSNAIVLVILIVAIALVAAPLLPGDGSRSASAEGTADAQLAGAGMARTRDGAGEWAMLVVGSALLVVGSALRKPRAIGPLPVSHDSAAFGPAIRPRRRVTDRARQHGRVGRRPTLTTDPAIQLDRHDEAAHQFLREPER